VAKTLRRKMEYRRSQIGKTEEIDDPDKKNLSVLKV